MSQELNNTPKSRSPQVPPYADGGASAVTIDDLLLRIRAGDRAAAAEFLSRYASRIRRRIRGKLGPDIRRLFDSLEILSTLSRRLDLYVMSGQFQPANVDQLWSLVFTMADNALIDKARLFRRLEVVEGEDSEFAQQFIRLLQQAETQHTSGAEIELDKCLRSIDDAIDRQVVSLWLMGQSHEQIADEVDLSAAAVGKRWERIKSHLRQRFDAGRL